MINKSTWLHLRIPFSFFLLPVFSFAFFLIPQYDIARTMLAFIALHFFLYPASNGYNSYFDKDEGSIGGLEKPPKISRQLYYVSLVFDVIALIIGFFISHTFVIMMFIYGVVSKLYSHPKVRLKKYPILGWLTVGVFQGAFTLMMSFHALTLTELSITFGNYKVTFAAILSTALLLGSYPMTQVYQHDEDGKRGDKTLSLLLGVKGTFYFTAATFSLTNLGFLYYFYTYYGIEKSVMFQVFMIPILFYFLTWFFRVYKDQGAANFKSTMRLNLVSAVCMNTFFIVGRFII